MFILMAAFAVVFVAMIVEVYFDKPLLRNSINAIERLFEGKGYLRFFGASIALALVGYALGAVALGPFIGLNAALYEVLTAYGTIFLFGIVACFFGFLGDVGRIGSSFITGTERKATPNTRIMTSIIFVSAMFGSLGCLVIHP